MKTALTLLSFFLTHFLFGQSSTILAHNNVAAHLMDNGYFFTDCPALSAGYEVPKGSGINAIYSSAFWFGGHDIASQLKIAATRYCGDGPDLWAGPLELSGNIVAPNPYTQTIWTVSKLMIDDHIANYQNAGYTVPSVIANWPAHGDVSLNMDYYMAPFVDMNNDGVYSPDLGDYPCIKGDMATYMIMNDAGGTHASGGGVMNVELHFLFYQYKTIPSLLNTTFIDIKAINRGNQILYDYFASYFMDADLGNHLDDYFGSDSTRNLMYTYNADNMDEDNGGVLGYGNAPPAIGVVCLSQDVSSIGYFTNSSTYPYSDPTNPIEYYNIMKAQWLDGTFWQDNNGNNTNFMYSGDPNDGAQWSEVSAAKIPDDRRMVMNAKYGTLNPGDVYELSYAVVLGQGVNNLNSVTDLFQQSDIAQAFYNQQISSCFDPATASLENLSKLEFSISPNPSDGQFSIILPEEFEKAEVTISDAFGRLVLSNTLIKTNEMDVQLNEGRGIYFVTIVTDKGSSIQKVVLN